jgi:hypothetical protein
MTDSAPGGSLRLTGDLVFSRMGYGATQLAGPGVFGPNRRWSVRAQTVAAQNARHRHHPAGNPAGTLRDPS